MKNTNDHPALLEKMVEREKERQTPAGKRRWGFRRNYISSLKRKYQDRK
ncbi:hypothetical protein [Flexithrix dorotheae]|nr:hypothetical protein [Flexithrix dorotheae]